MVYDRGRPVGDPHEGAQYGSSGSPRSRYVSDTAKYTQRPGPARSHAVQSSAGEPLAYVSKPGAQILICNSVSRR